MELIQVMRGAAAVVVVLYHVTRQSWSVYQEYFLGGLFLWGHAGVDFFFVLSGFIIYWVHEEHAGRPRLVGRFMAARFVRVYPAYWLVLAATLAYDYLYPGTGDFAFARDVQVRALALYNQLNQPIVPIAWTLSFEVLFYLFFCVCILFGRVVFWAAALVWSAMIVAQWAGLRTFGWYPILLGPLILEFFLGCLAAFFVRRFHPRIAAGWLVVLVVLVAAVGAAERYGLVDEYANVRNYGLVLFLLVLAAAAYDVRTRRRYWWPLVLLGEASYAIYLTHYLGHFYSYAVYFRNPVITQTLGVQPALVLMCVVLLAIGIAFHLLVERPLLTMGRRYLVARC